ncbi:MAG: hypothetical protein V1709_01015 [Planctomycetota bacterium]
MPTKQALIDFLEEKVFRPAENHPMTDKTIKKKVQCTRMRLNQYRDWETVEKYFWSAMASDAGKDSYRRLHRIGATAFEDVIEEFKRLCGRT